MSPDAIACSGRAEREELRASVARSELGEAHQLPRVREVGVAADRFEDGDRPSRDAAQRSGSGGARMKATCARSISARSSVGSSLWRLASSIASASAASAASSAPVPRSARPSSVSNAARSAGSTARSRQARSSSDAAAANSPRSSARVPRARAGGRLSARPRGRRRRPTELRADRGTPARGGSRRSRSCPVSCAPACASSQEASRTWRSARSSLGMDA